MEKVLNKKEYVMDMTEGSSMKLIMKFSVPLLIGNLFQQVYSLVDSIVVGRHIGANALGGVGSVGMISFLFFSCLSSFCHNYLLTTQLLLLVLLFLDFVVSLLL